MAIKPPDILSRLPSVSELLDKPPVRALVDRWNRSTVAGGLRSFLDEVRTDIERRAADLPSIRELADRAAKYVVSRQQHALGIAINATGQLSGTTWASTPAPEIALEQLISLGREYSPADPTTSCRPTTELESVLCRLTGAEAATAVHSYCGAVWLALAALAHGHDVLVARADVGDVEGGNSLANLAAAAGASLQEVGATNRTTATDYLSAASPRTPALLSLSADNYRVIGDTAMPSLEELIAVARERELCFIDALGGAPLVEPPVSIDWPRRSAAASIAAGTNVTILRGDGLVGGPACGLLLGDKQSIQQIVSHPLFSLIRLDPLRSAAVLATAECYDSPSRGADSIPVWQCLGTSLDNLRNRAERMAAQLGHVSGVTSATAVESRSPLFASLSGDGFPSYGVALTPEDGNVAALHARLGQARIPIGARPEKEQLVLDLRTVPPRHDKVIVDSLLS